MGNRNYWLDLFTGQSWQEFLDAGGDISGFSENRWKTLQKVRPGDYFLCYLTGISRFVGILEVVSNAFKDTTKIWKDNVFPSRVKVKIIAALQPATAVPVKQLSDQLSCFIDMKSPHAWTGRFRGSPAKWNAKDGMAVVNAVLEAKKNPVVRPVDPKALAYRPKGIKSKIGSVTVPESEQPIIDIKETGEEQTDHLKIQFILYSIAKDMGLDIWIARNDKGRIVNGKRFADLPKIRDKLPLNFDQATIQTIELIDVLWLDKNSILAAFEIESTTSIYSGLLRMSDLIAMQPNLNIPLFLVAPDDRREKVFNEVNRPTFTKMNPPLSGICKFISFSSLENNAKKYSEVIHMMNPNDFLDYISETCDIEEA
jgi:hypothetical protein